MTTPGLKETQKRLRKLHGNAEPDEKPQPKPSKLKSLFSGKTKKKE